MNGKFKGIFTALLTPFDEENRINTDALCAAIDFNLKMGIKGFYVCGSTGEAFLLSEAERVQIMRTVAKHVNGRGTLIAHVGCISTDSSIRLAKEAESMGYDAISSVAPFYYKFSFDEIRTHYFDIVDQVGLPMLVYNFPAFSNVNLSVDALSEFLKDERFLGVKHTSQDLYAMEAIKTAFPDKIIYNGYDEMCLAGLATGADGAIGSTYNFMGDKFVRLQSAVEHNDLAAARAIQHEANVIITCLLKYGIMAAEKAVMTGLGINFGNPRKPCKPLSGDQSAELCETILPMLSCRP